MNALVACLLILLVLAVGIRAVRAPRDRRAAERPKRYGRGAATPPVSGPRASAALPPATPRTAEKAGAAPAGLDEGLAPILTLEPAAQSVPSDRALWDPAMGSTFSRELIENVGGRILARQSLIDALSDSPKDPAELTKAVVADPSLAAHILRTVNSSFYGLRAPIGSIFRAVIFLGHLEVRNIIWKACFSDAAWTSPSPAEAAFLEQFWRHSFECSRFAYTLAKTLGLDVADKVATAALLHDVGKIIALSTQGEAALPLYAEGRYSTGPRLLRERTAYGCDHARLGAEAAALWGLPAESREAIARHHEPAFRPPDGNDCDPRLILAVHLANAHAHLAADDRGGADIPEIHRPLDSWLELIGLSRRGERAA
jgi:putative nucleotidyltransferase with HDIG domain